MRDHSHYAPLDNGVCETCGRPLGPSYGMQGPNRIGLGVAIALHLLVAVFLITHNKMFQTKAPPKERSTIVYFTPSPLKQKPQPKKPEKAVKEKVPVIPPSANAITLPVPKKLEATVEKEIEKPKLTEAPEAVDMAALIAQRRAAREAQQPQAAPQETEAERGLRLAKANIQSANGKAGADREDTGGVFSILNQRYHTADVRFNAWNANFKRKWSKVVTVEQGTDPDIETSIVKKMIELIRQEKKGDFTWDSRRLRRPVQMSARIEDNAELEAFLMKEMFPEHRPVAR